MLYEELSEKVRFVLLTCVVFTVVIVSQLYDHIGTIGEYQTIEIVVFFCIFLLYLLGVSNRRVRRQTVALFIMAMLTGTFFAMEFIFSAVMMGLLISMQLYSHPSTEVVKCRKQALAKLTTEDRRILGI